MKKLLLPIAISLLVGCASASKDLTASYASPLSYKDYDCEQIAWETARVHRQVNQLGGTIDKASSDDKAQSGVSLLLFWPSVFFIGGNNQQEAGFSRLKGEVDALEAVAITKKCLA